MVSNRFKQPISRVRHVAIVTLASARLQAVARVSRDVFSNRRVTLKACLIAGHSPGQLIVRITFMHGMARQAGHAAADMARGFDKTAILATGDADHAIGPKDIVQELRVGLHLIWNTRILVAARVSQKRCRRLQIRARSIREAGTPIILEVGNIFHRVTLAAYFR